ncbi:MAG: Hsp20/alpha crystallin family protein [Gemmataceae bacterium]
MNRTCRGPFGALWNDVNTVQDEVAKLFNRVAPFVAAPAAGPHLNVWEDDQAIFVEADLPGVDPEKIDVTVTEGNQLTLRGERKAPQFEGATWIRQERPNGEFLREIGLPALVNADAVEAKYENGVLRLTLPKHEAVKPRKIEVKFGA